jgi:hypothetical protein
MQNCKCCLLVCCLYSFESNRKELQQKRVKLNAQATALREQLGFVSSMGSEYEALAHTAIKYKEAIAAKMDRLKKLQCGG